MTRRLVDIDARLLRAAQRELRTETTDDTVNRALARVAGGEPGTVSGALDALADIKAPPRTSAWR